MTTHCLDPNRHIGKATDGSQKRAGDLSAKRGPSARTWTREQIRAARVVPLAPLLQKRGLQLVERPAQNIAVPQYQGLLVKDCYWRWPERNQACNAIDFFMKVLGLSFHEAMRQILGS